MIWNEQSGHCTNRSAAQMIAFLRLLQDRSLHRTRAYLQVSYTCSWLSMHSFSRTFICGNWASASAVIQEDATTELPAAYSAELAQVTHVFLEPVKIPWHILSSSSSFSADNAVESGSESQGSWPAFSLQALNPFTQKDAKQDSPILQADVVFVQTRRKWFED